MSTTKNPLLELIEEARTAERENKASVSDIHAIRNSEPYLRIDGVNKRNTRGDRLTDADITDFINRVGVEHMMALETDKCITVSYHTEETGPFRAHIQQSHRGYKVVIRLLHDRVPPFESLGLPKKIKSFADLKNGLVLVTGGTGSGKSTTLASLIDYINKTRGGAICTVEDPIEYLHESELCDVTQMSVGRDTPSFAQGIKSVLRMDPDVILIGEIRDQVSALYCLQAAETGHLVFATLHDNSAEETVTRLINMFPGDMQNQVRIGLSTSLRAVVAQTLVKKAAGKGRLAIAEIMVLNDAIKGAIRKSDEHQIYSMIDSGRNEYQMETMENALATAYKTGLITYDDALDAANRKDAIGKLMKNVA